MSKMEIVTCLAFALVVVVVLVAEVVGHSRVVAVAPAVCALATGCK